MTAAEPQPILADYGFRLQAVSGINARLIEGYLPLGAGLVNANAATRK